MLEPSRLLKLDAAIRDAPSWKRFLAVMGWFVVAGITTWIACQHGWRLADHRGLPPLTYVSALLYWPFVMLALWLTRHRDSAD